MQSKRSLEAFPLPSNVRHKLHAAGYTDVQDLTSMGPISLSKEIDISYVEATNVFKILDSCSREVRDISGAPRLTAFDLLQQEQDQMHIVTFSQNLDRLLDGGIPLGKTTEICGVPGIGKTQLCLQLCVDVQIPEGLGGVGGDAIFIDTEGTFTVERLEDMARGCLQHCNVISQKDPTLKEHLTSFSVDGILRGVHYYHCFDYLELVALINTLPEFLQKHPKVRLVVIDSIAFHFRFGFEGNFAVRSRILSSVFHSLVRIAFESPLAVVLTNHMTTRIDPEGQSSVVPALGEGWGQSCTLRLLLQWQDAQRTAFLLKSPSHRADSAPFQIMTAGVRDVVVNSNSDTSHIGGSPQQISKRPKLNN